MFKNIFFSKADSVNEDWVLLHLEKELKAFLMEDDLGRNFYYAHALPNEMVKCQLRFKSKMVVAGLPFFFAVFNLLGAKKINWEEELEGAMVGPGTALSFELPFACAITGERIALNLLQRASAIATYTKQFVEMVERSGETIAILDTRKTTPGLRFLEKYAVRMGGGYNHRLGQADLWMVKDNHKKYFGGIKEAIDFFRSMGNFYQPIEVEIHELEEIGVAISLGIKHLMLDNFSPAEVKKAISIKNKDITYEISGGINLNNIQDYLLSGVDAISIGGITSYPPPVDISLKMDRR